MANAQRQRYEIALAYLDVDQFKSINDQQGHLKGDEVLKYLGQFILDSIRQVDVACRYGGDEFCLVFPHCGQDEASQVCESIQSKFQEKYPGFSLSIGVATTGPEHYCEIDQLIRSADERMYISKMSGSVRSAAS